MGTNESYTKRNDQPFTVSGFRNLKGVQRVVASETSFEEPFSRFWRPSGPLAKIKTRDYPSRVTNEPPVYREHQPRLASIQ